MQKIVRNTQELYPVAVRDTLMQSNSQIIAPPLSYAFYGNQLFVFPLDASSTYPIDVRYNYLPALYTSLNDNDYIPWPDGFDSALTFEVAARGLAKGDAENMTQLKSVANEAMLKLKGNIPREYVGPSVPNLVDSPISWGSM